METTRRRAHNLRTGAVQVQATGKPAPLTNSEKARRELRQLLMKIPTRVHVLIPRNCEEAHHRPDSLCVLLGLSFRILGPLLIAASILVAHRKGGYFVSSEGFELLVNSYSWEELHRLTLQEKKPSAKALQVDARSTDAPPTARIKFYYIYHGHITPIFVYKPLVSNNLMVERFDRASIRAKQLSEKITSEEPAIRALINELTHLFPIDTNHLIGEAPSLITPTEQPQLPVA